MDIAHEALLEGWAQFAEWRQEDRDLRRLEQRLEDAYEEWKEREGVEAKERDNYLLTGGLLAEVREQQGVLSERLNNSRPALMKYFADSDQKNAENVAILKEALARADMQEASRKVRDKLLFTPAQTVEATLSAIDLVHRSQQDFAGDVVYPAQDALHRAWFKIRERLKLEGHSSSVHSVAFSPDRDRIVSGSADNTLRLWDLAGNVVGSPFKGHSDWVRSVAFSPDGDRIVSGSFDHTLRLWDLSGNAIGSPFEGHSSSVHSVAFNPDGDRIVSGSFDHTLRLWDLSGNAIGSPFEGHSSLVRSVAFSPDGDRIVSGSNDSTLRLWCVGTWKDELRYCCNLLMHHTALAFPQTAAAQSAGEVCQQVWERPQSAEFLVAQGNALARRGEVDKAIAKITRAKELDPAITIDPTARANELADWSRSR